MYAVIWNLLHRGRARCWMNVSNYIQINCVDIVHSDRATISHREIRPLILFMSPAMSTAWFLTIFLQSPTSLNLSSGSATCTTRDLLGDTKAKPNSSNRQRFPKAIVQNLLEVLTLEGILPNTAVNSSIAGNIKKNSYNQCIKQDWPGIGLAPQARTLASPVTLALS
jgi:hypothetical protein